jgi:hypothetical protein
LRVIHPHFSHEEKRFTSTITPSWLLLFLQLCSHRFPDFLFARSFLLCWFGILDLQGARNRTAEVARRWHECSMRCEVLWTLAKLELAHVGTTMGMGNQMVPLAWNEMQL